MLTIFIVRAAIASLSKYRSVWTIPIAVCLLLSTEVSIGFSQGGSLPRAQVSSHEYGPSPKGDGLRGILSSKTMVIHFYFIAVDDHGRSGKRIGCGDSLVAVSRPIPWTRTPLTTAFQLLLANRQRFYGQSGLYNVLYQARMKFKRAAVAKGKAMIYLTGKLYLRGVCDEPRAEWQLKQTALQFPTVHSVAIVINNIPLHKVLYGR